MYVYKRVNSYVVVRNNHTYVNVKSKELAEFISEMLVKVNWDVSNFPSILEFNDEFLILHLTDDKIHFVSKYSSRDDALNNYDSDVQEFLYNPNKTKYGSFIYLNNNYFYISKSVNGIVCNFGFFEDLGDARFVKEILMDNGWNIDNLDNIYYNRYFNTYDIITVFRNRVRILKSFNTLDEAQDNLNEVLANFEEKKLVLNEPFINKNGNLFAVTTPNNKYMGSFRHLDDACAVRDFLERNNWELPKISTDDIHEINGYYWRFAPFKNYLKIVAKYSTFDDAFLNQNNLSDFSIADLKDPNNPYLHINRNIWIRGDKFEVRNRINGELFSYGIYDTREEAIKARDEFEANDWVVNSDKDSLFNDSNDGNFAEIILGLSLWQKMIYGAIDRMDDSEFAFDDLLNHSSLKNYRHGNFNDKVSNNLNDLMELGLVEKLDNNVFRALWK